LFWAAGFKRDAAETTSAPQILDSKPLKEATRMLTLLHYIGQSESQCQFRFKGWEDSAWKQGVVKNK
jgi:hypothetical protein